MCLPGTVERKVYTAGKAFLLLSEYDLGMKCGVCNKYCCPKCLEKIVGVFPNDMKKNNHWYMYVIAFIDENKKRDLQPRVTQLGRLWDIVASCVFLTKGLR